MIRFEHIRRSVALIIVTAVAVPALAQPPVAPPATGQSAHTEFKNLKVLPKDIPPAELRRLMNSFTRALGVRCIHCHVGEEGRPFRPDEFPLDDKPTKLKAREMLKMVNDINEKYLAALDHRAEPAIRIECATCHRGATQPRMLQDVLKAAYDTGGIDSTMARYRSLRERFYGRFTYDFSEVPLADVGAALFLSGHAADAESLLSYNVTLNPASAFARRQHAVAAISDAFQTDAAKGASVVGDMRARYGEAMVSEVMLNAIAYELLGRQRITGAIAAFQQNVNDHPASANAYDSLGEGLMAGGNLKRAKEAYARSLQLDPTNANAKQKLEEIKHAPKGGARGGR